MKVKVNQETKELEDNSTLAILMEQLSLSEQGGVAVAVNQEICPKADWGNQKLEENDSITIIRATQGG